MSKFAKLLKKVNGSIKLTVDTRNGNRLYTGVAGEVPFALSQMAMIDVNIVEGEGALNVVVKVG